MKPSKGQEEQSGQALAEGFLAMLVLASLWVAVAWLGHLQDMALSAQHASRLAAFSHTRNPLASTALDPRDSYFQSPGHQWSDRSGDDLLAVARHQVHVDLNKTTMLSQAAQPGGNGLMVDSLRRSWTVQDEGIVDASVDVTPRSGVAKADGTALLGLSAFDEYPTLRRHTAVLAGAGHASNDGQVQHTVAQSALAWSDSASVSIAIGGKVDAAMAAVDAPWQRARPLFDWLGPWAGQVPARRLAYSAKEP